MLNRSAVLGGLKISHIYMNEVSRVGMATEVEGPRDRHDIVLCQAIIRNY